MSENNNINSINNNVLDINNLNNLIINDNNAVNMHINNSSPTISLQSNIINNDIELLTSSQLNNNMLNSIADISDNKDETVVNVIDNIIKIHNDETDLAFDEERKFIIRLTEAEFVFGEPTHRLTYNVLVHLLILYYFILVSK